MFAKYNKAIGAILGGLISLFAALNLLPPDLVTPEIIGSISAIGATALTYLFPKNDSGPPDGTKVRAPSLSVFAAVALSLMMMGCATKPETPRQALYVADATFAAAVEELITLRDAGVLRAGSDAETLAKRVVQNVDVALEAAHAAARIGDMDGVAGYLRAINAGLSTLTRLITQTRSLSDAERSQLSPVAGRCGEPLLFPFGHRQEHSGDRQGRGPGCYGRGIAAGARA